METAHRVATIELSPKASKASERAIAAEVPVAISFFGIGYAVMMATPADLEDFAVGFARSERLIETAAEVLEIGEQAVEQGIALSIELVPDRRDLAFERVRHRIGESSCGVCGIENLEQALRPLPVVGRPPDSLTRGSLFAALDGLRSHQPLNAQTGAVHAAGFADATGKLVAVREDVGRHNAFDKLIGHGMRTGLDLRGGFALLTSRCSFELVEKAALAGIGTLVTVSAPTTLAVARAQEASLTLVALARPDAMLVMTDPYRKFSPGV